MRQTGVSITLLLNQTPSCFRSATSRSRSATSNAMVPPSATLGRSGTEVRQRQTVSAGQVVDSPAVALVSDRAHLEGERLFVAGTRTPHLGGPGCSRPRPRVPLGHTARCTRIPREPGGQGPIHRRNQRRRSLLQEAPDPGLGPHEVLRQLRVRRAAYDHQQGNAVADYRCEFVRLVADARVAGDGDPAALAHGTQPLFVRALGCEVSCVSLDVEAGGREASGKCVAEVAIGEVDDVQAACSYRTACSISCGERS